MSADIKLTFFMGKSSLVTPEYCVWGQRPQVSAPFGAKYPEEHGVHSAAPPLENVPGGQREHSRVNARPERESLRF